MSEEKEPFTEYVTQGEPGLKISRAGWIAAGLMAVLVIVVVVLWTSARSRLDDLERVRVKLDDANASLSDALAHSQQDKFQIASLQTNIASLQTNIAALQSQAAGLQKDKELASQREKKLENELRSGLESRDVAISNLQGRLTVTILDRVMFDSGQAILQPDGESVLRKIASFLTQHPDLKVHIIGNTDNVPIRHLFPSNWELSAARALAAVHFLTEEAGVDPHRVGAVGYGEYRPIADNATAEGRAKNRRIAIVILADELAGADAAPSAKTNAPTDSEPPAAPVSAPAPKD